MDCCPQRDEFQEETIDSQAALHVLFLEHLRGKRIMNCKDLGE